jgi:hypothetical protein
MEQGKKYCGVSIKSTPNFEKLQFLVVKWRIVIVLLLFLAET